MYGNLGSARRVSVYSIAMLEAHVLMSPSSPPAPPEHLLKFVYAFTIVSISFVSS